MSILPRQLLSCTGVVLAVALLLTAVAPEHSSARTADRGGPAGTAALPASYRLFLAEVGGSHFVTVRGEALHYVAMGDPARPTLLLVHGSPDNVFTWRNILPILATRYHVVAVDLLGFGRSAQPAMTYGWQVEIDYLTGFIRALGLRHITLIGTDIGGLFSFAYAQQHPANVAGLAFWETFVAPIASMKALAYCGPCAGFFPRDAAPNLAYARKNPQFIAGVYAQSLLSTPDSGTLAAYAFPFATPAARAIPVEIGANMPIGGQPASTYATIAAYARYLTSTATPKLALYATPGYVMPLSVLQKWGAGVPNLTIAPVGKGYHYLSEDEPGAIAQQILAWRATF